MSVPNQKIIRIQRKKYQKNFLQIGSDEWHEAVNNLRPSAFTIYLYLADNRDGFLLEMSAVTIEKLFGIKKSSYHNALKELEEKGYLQKEQGNTYSFSSSPNSKKMEPGTENSKKLEYPSEATPKNYYRELQKITIGSPKNYYRELQNFDRETDNTNKTNITDIKKEVLESQFGRDGALLKGEGWIDTYIPNFYALAREKQIEVLSTTPIFGLTIPQAEYVVDKILN